jgi:hypothetical protein
MELRRGGNHWPLFLPPRSLLVLAEEARLAWHHYIPHRRADTLAGRCVPRASRRVSFTFRKVAAPNCAWVGILTGLWRGFCFNPRCVDW